MCLFPLFAELQPAATTRGPAAWLPRAGRGQVGSCKPPAPGQRPLWQFFFGEMHAFWPAAFRAVHSSSRCGGPVARRVGKPLGPASLRYLACMHATQALERKTSDHKQSGTPPPQAREATSGSHSTTAPSIGFAGVPQLLQMAGGLQEARRLPLSSLLPYSCGSG